MVDSVDAKWDEARHERAQDGRFRTMRGRVERSQVSRLRLQADQWAEDPARVTIRDPNVRRIGAALRARGHEAKLVGGPVRDELLGREASDMDMTTSAMPDETRAILDPLGSVFLQGERFGTVGVNIVGADGAQSYEVTTFRGDEKYTADSRNPEVTLGVTLEEDLGRRDFTINAMAADTETGEVTDPYGGMADLDAGILRTPLDPDVTFRDDALRIARAVRFSATLDFELEAETLAGAQRNAARLSGIARERRTAEIRKILASSRPGALDVALERSRTIGVTEEMWAGIDVDAASAAHLAAVPPRARLAALAYATGPPAAGHLRAMTFSNDEVTVAERVRVAARSAEAARSLPEARLIVRGYSDDELADAEAVSSAFGRPHPETMAQARSEAALVRRPLPVNGNDAMDVGLRGPDVGAALSAVEKMFLADPTLSRVDALSALAERTRRAG